MVSGSLAVAVAWDRSPTRRFGPTAVDGRWIARSDVPRQINGLATLAADIVLVHSSDLHVDDDPHQGPYGEDGTAGLRVVLDAAKAHNADYVLLVGDIFDNNRQSAGIVSRCVSLLHGAGRPVIVLPGNHDPVTPDSVWRRGGLDDLPNVYIIGLTHDVTVHFPEHDLEVWGHAH